MRLRPDSFACGRWLKHRDLQLEDRLATRHPVGVVDQRVGAAPGAVDLGAASITAASSLTLAVTVSAAANDPIEHVRAVVPASYAPHSDSHCATPSQTLIPGFGPTRNVSVSPPGSGCGA
jgi:hypothetical protein